MTNNILYEWCVEYPKNSMKRRVIRIDETTHAQLSQNQFVVGDRNHIMDVKRVGLWNMKITCVWITLYNELPRLISDQGVWSVYFQPVVRNNSGYSGFSHIIIDFIHTICRYEKYILLESSKGFLSMWERRIWQMENVSTEKWDTFKIIEESHEFGSLIITVVSLWIEFGWQKYLCLYVVTEWYPLFILLRRIKYMNETSA